MAFATEPCEQRARHRPAGRAAGHRTDRVCHRMLQRQHAARRLHDQNGRGQPGLAEPRREPLQITAQSRSHIGVDRRRTDPVVLPFPAQHLMRQGYEGRPAALRYKLANARLMRAVAVRIDEEDDKTLDSGLLQGRDGAAHRRLVQRGLRFALGVDPLRHLQPLGPPDQRRREGRADVVPVLLAAVAQLDDVAKSLGRDQPEVRSLPFDHQIRRDGRAVQEQGRRTEQRREITFHRLSEERQTVHHAARRVVRRRRCLGGVQRPGIVDTGQVGKGAADIHADAHRSPRTGSSPVRPHRFGSPAGLG